RRIPGCGQPAGVRFPGGGGRAGPGETGMKLRGLLFAATALAASPASAEIALTPVWGDHVVIQRDKPIVVEGRAAPGAKIAASLGEAHGLATADADGRF